MKNWKRVSKRKLPKCGFGRYGHRSSMRIEHFVRNKRLMDLLYADEQRLIQKYVKGGKSWKN